MNFGFSTIFPFPSRSLAFSIALLASLFPGTLPAAPASTELPTAVEHTAGLSDLRPEFPLLKPADPLAAHQSRVVLIVLDGIRTEEFFRGSILMGRRAKPAAELMPFVNETLIGERQALVLGNRFAAGAGRHACFVNNRRFVSLPGYADLLGGTRQPGVNSNRFRGRLVYPTVVDRLVRRGLRPNQMAFFASWKHIENVVTRTGHPDLHIDTGRKPGERKPPWGDARYDVDLMRAVDDYLEDDVDHLRFLFVAFNDSDEWAHKRNYRRYIQSLRQQDDYIRRIYNSLEERPAFRGRTTYIVTTDHGRGIGRRWAHHGKFPGSQYIWAVVHSPRPHFVSAYEHATWMRQLRGYCSHSSLGFLTFRLLDTSSARTIELGKKAGLR